MSINQKRLEEIAGSAADANRLARAIWARVTEPADPLLGAILDALGASEALSWLHSITQTQRHIAHLPMELCNIDRPTRDRILKALGRWQPRLAAIEVDREMRALELFDGEILTPQDSTWPQGLTDLGYTAPACLWVRGAIDLAVASQRSVAIVGARACTSYGEEVTGQLVSDLSGRDFAIVSGGAYGIDIAAHRVALAVHGVTIAVLAGGADRLYPRGNAHVLQEVAETGLVISEHPPGSAPTRARFLTRNRLIAALAQATVVVEAAWRSGALSTARHAAKLGRPLGAVPGPVTSMMSGGCHELLRENGAICVTDGAEIAELAGQIGADLRPERTPAPPTLFDTLDEVEAAVTEALPLRNGATIQNVARTAGLTIEQTMATLAKLEMSEIAFRDGSMWRRGNEK